MSKASDIPDRKPRLVILASLAESLINFRGEMLNEMVERGFEVHAVGPNMPSETRAQLETMKCIPHEIQMQRTGLNPIKDALTLWRLYRLFRRIQPDIFLGYTIKPVIYGNLAAWLARVPKRAALITGLGFSFVAKEAGLNGLIMKMARRLLRYSLSKTHIVIFQNPDDLALFQQLKMVSHQTTGVVNGSGVDINHFQVQRLPDQPVFLLIARLVIEKGIREYVKAAGMVRQHLPDARFLLAGPLESSPSAISQHELDEWIESKQIDYLGNLKDVRPAMASSRIYVLPSYREGTPKTVLEAMAMGRPIITTDTPGCRQPIIPEENGILVPVRSVAELTSAMVRLGSDVKLSAKMGAVSRGIAEDRYDVHTVNSTILKLLGI